MSKNFIKTKLEKNKIKKIKSDKFLKCFIVFFIVAQALFFTSNYYLPHIYKKTSIVTMGEIADLGEYKLTIDSWDYNSEKNQFEIIFELDDLSVEKEKEKLEFFCFTKTGDIKEGKIYKKIDNLIIVRFDNIPKSFKEVTLNISFSGNSKVFSMNDKNINFFNGADKSNNEYILYAQERKLQGFKKAIKVLDDKKEDLKKQYETCLKKWDRLEEKKSTQSDEDKKRTAAWQSDLSTQAEKIKSSLDEVMIKIEDYKNKIEIQEKILKDLQEKR